MLRSRPRGPSGTTCGEETPLSRRSSVLTLTGLLRNVACPREVKGDHVKTALRKLNADAGVGLDVWSGRELRAPPAEALEELAGNISAIISSVSWPLQALHNQVVLIGKPKGGDRPICLVPLIVKLWETICGDTVLSWDKERIGFWDDAVKGSSALRAAGLRRL